MGFVQLQPDILLSVLDKNQLENSRANVINTLSQAVCYQKSRTGSSSWLLQYDT